MDQLWLIPVLLFLIIIQLLNAETPYKSKVVASLYDTVTLPCSFPLLKESKGLTAVWKRKDKDGRTVIAHKFRDGPDIFNDQDIRYTGRTAMSNDFSTGRLDLTLRDVNITDEGTYLCQAANGIGYGTKEVELTIGDLNADDSMVTVIHVDGKKRLKCINVGVFRDPGIKWYNMQVEDLSAYGMQSITDIGDGRKLVESVLEMDVERDTHYFCQLREGKLRLRRIARAVLSDGKPIAFPEIKLPE